MRPVRRLSLLLVAAVAIGATAAGCGGAATEAPAPPPLRSLAAVVDAGRTAQTGRFSLDLEVESAGRHLGMSGDGAFDAPARRARFSLDLSELARTLAREGGSAVGDPGDWKVEAVQSGNALYLKAGLLRTRLPHGAEWVRIDPTELGRLQGSLGQLGSMGQSDPRDLVESLRAVSGSLVVVGRETVRGDATTRYRAALDPARLAGRAAASGLGDGVAQSVQELFGRLGVTAVPVDVWVGDDGLLRRLSLSLSVTPPGTAEPASVSLVLELYDYGDDVGIDVPLPDEAVDAAALGQLP